MLYKSFSIRADGNMYLAREGRSEENVENRRRYFEREGLLGKKIVAANLIHGTKVAVVTLDSPEFILDTDALVTKEKDIVLTLTGADCFPVFFEDISRGIIGLAHCGWRGIVGKILEETINAILSLTSERNEIPRQVRNDSNNHLQDIKITIGPGICERHFEIQEDILAHFVEYPEAIIQNGKGIFVDLRAIMKEQLKSLGVVEESIIDQNECTCCLPEKYFSFRRDRPEQIETMIATIVILS